MDAVLKGTRESLKLGSALVKVGRSQENQLVLENPEVSWFHAQILHQERSYYVVDLGSSNGTFVNEQKLSPNVPRRLNDGDVVRFGSILFSYIADINPHSPTKLAAHGSKPIAAVSQRQRLPMNAKTRLKNTPNWIIVAGGLASLATIFVAIWGVYTYLHPTPPPPSPTLGPTNSPSIPHLHSSYTGSYTRVDGKIFALVISSLTEDSNGNFNATGNDGACPAVFQGVVYANDTISFTVKEAQMANCGLVGEFQGQVYPDGHLAGQWQGAVSQTSGTWTVS